MSLSGIYNGIRNETYEDYLDENGPVSVYTVDWSCLDVKYFIFKGKSKNVTIHMYCGENGKEMFSKKNISIDGKYKIESRSIKWNQCISEESSGVRMIISITDKNDNEIYRCEITGSECEG
jgi:hypothetical protein